MKRFLISLLLLTSIEINAQSQVNQTEQRVSADPVSRPIDNPNKNIILNETGLIQIHKGDLIKFYPNLSPLPRRHQFLKGLFKSAVTFTFASQVNKAVVHRGEYYNGQKATNLAPVLGLSLASGLPDMIKGLKGNKSYLIFTLYDVDKNAFMTDKLLLRSKSPGQITNKAFADGYIKAVIIGDARKVTSGSLDIAISHSVPFKGASIDGNFAMNNSEDCFGDGDGGGDDPDWGDTGSTTAADCYSKAAAIAAAALTFYLDAVGVCAEFVFPPAVGVCVLGATAAYATVELSNAVWLQNCLNKAK